MDDSPNKDVAAIGIDWGTSSFRAMLLSRTGQAIETQRAAAGILTIENRDFEGALRTHIGDWLAEFPKAPVVLSGMIGSRQGWVEAPYLDCPADLRGIARAMTDIRLADRRWVSIAPGLTCRDADGVPDVMRGEEVQILGAVELLGIADSTFCLPGTHSKWVKVENRRVTGFATHMTGEVYDVVRRHTILSRTISADEADDSWDDAAFVDGVTRSGQTGGLLHHLFGVRASGLFGELAPQGSGAFLSGLLIGHEIREAMPGGVVGAVHLIGEPRLVNLYIAALGHLGHKATAAPTEATAAGLFQLVSMGKSRA